MGTLSALLALCVGIHWLLVVSQYKEPMMQSFDGFFVVSLDKLLKLVKMKCF